MGRIDLLSSIQQPVLNNNLLPKKTSSFKTPSDKKAGDPAEKRLELQKGAKAFEAYFIQSLLKEMRKSISSDEKTGKGLGKSTYTSMFDEAIAQKIAASGGIGLSRLLTEKLSQSLKFSGQTTDKIEE